MLDYNYDPKTDIILVKYGARTTDEDIVHYLESIKKNFGHRNSIYIMHDFQEWPIPGQSELSTIAIDISEIISKLKRAWSKFDFVASASVFTEEQAKPILEFYSVMSQKVSNYQNQVFGDQSEAEAWLASKKLEYETRVGLKST